jgi:hypothetical protein
MMNKQILTRMFFSVLACFTVQCEPEKEQEFPSQLVMNINERNRTFEKKNLSVRQSETFEKDKLLIISAYQAKDSLILHRFSFIMSVKNVSRFSLNSQIKFSDAGTLVSVLAVESDDDAVIGWYVPEVNVSSFVLTELDTLNRVVSGRFEGVFHVEDAYKSGPMVRFRQFPDSFEVKDGRFRVKYEDFINK